MIEVDQAALDASLRAFSASIQHKAQFIGAAVSGVLRVECNRLAQTLLKQTPPVSKEAAEKKIDKDVRRRFRGKTVPDSTLNKYAAGGSTKHGRREVYWYFWTDTMLGGFKSEINAKAFDITRLKEFYRKELKAYRPSEERSTRGKQAVGVKRSVAVAKSQIGLLVTVLRKNIGRLKAGWLAGWEKTGSGTGIYKPPQWVTRHLSGTYSDANITNLNSSSVPSVSITNRVRNVTSPGMMRIAQLALKIRLEAIPKRLVQLIKIKRKVSPAEFESILAQEVGV